MRLSARCTTALLLALLAGCGGDTPTAPAVKAGVRVINAFTVPLGITIDGKVVDSALAAGSIDTMSLAPGLHELDMTSSNPSFLVTIVSVRATIASASLMTIAAVRASNGNLNGVMLDDTNSVVPAGATKLRVLHLAPNAGTLQVFRTQPDYQHPIAWQFPFNYQPAPTSLTAPFYQSTVGSWEVRVWQTPADSSGWATAPARAVIPLASGEKKTVLLLDKAGGGVRIAVM
jgi:hypothetical protein